MSDYTQEDLTDVDNPGSEEPFPCMKCAGRPAGEPKCSGFLGDQSGEHARCKRSFCKHTVAEHG